MPTTRPPNAGHHIQCTRRREKKSSTKYNMRVIEADTAPLTSPATTHDNIAIQPGSGVSRGNSGPEPAHSGRRKPAIAQANPTGNRLRGRSSNKSSSTANNTAARGVPNTAVIPAQAPATSSALRSAAVRWNAWARSDAAAPPVMMIGPSAPNGPPLPITMPDDRGFSMATLGDLWFLLLWLVLLVSGLL